MATSRALLRDPLLWILVAGDTLVFLIFSAGGQHSHNETSNAGSVVVIALPFIVGWFALAPWVGAFQLGQRLKPGTFLGRTLFAWVCAWPAGLLLRAAVEHRAVPPGFDIVALLFNGLFLLVWRGAYLLTLRRLRRF